MNTITVSRSVIQIRCERCDGGACDRQRAGMVCLDCGGTLREVPVNTDYCGWCNERTICTVHGCYRRYGKLTELNAVEKAKTAGKPFGPVVIQFPEKAGGSWWLMRAGADRHSHFAYSYRSLPELLREWRITITGSGKDSAGSYLTCEVTA